MYSSMWNALILFHSIFLFNNSARNSFCEGAEAKMILIYSFVFNNSEIFAVSISAAAAPNSGRPLYIFTVNLSLLISLSCGNL